MELHSYVIKLLMYIDDIILLSKDSLSLQQHLDILNVFCNNSKIEINHSKTKMIMIG